MTTTWLAYFPSPPRGVWHLGPLPLRAYAFFIITGIIVALLIGDRRFVARGGERGVIYDIALWLVPFGLIGGRLYHLATDWPTYFGPGGAGLGAALRIWDGGLGIWGAVALGAVGAWIGCRRRGIPLPAFLDAVAPGVVLAQAIGRLGNYFNQELYGRETTLPWGLEIFYRRDPAGFVDVHSLDGVSTGQVALVVQPTFLYELIWNVLVFAALIYLDRRFTIGHGRLFGLYVALYCVGRFCVELLRDDTATHIAGIRINSFTSTFVFIGAVVYVILAPKGREDRATVRGHVEVAEEERELEPAEVSASEETAAAATVAGTAATSGRDDAGDSADTVHAAEVAEADTAKAEVSEPSEASESPEPSEPSERSEPSETEAAETEAAEVEAEEPETVQAEVVEPAVEEPEEPEVEEAEAEEAEDEEAEAEEPEAEEPEAEEAEAEEAEAEVVEAGEAEAEEPEAEEPEAEEAEDEEAEAEEVEAGEAEAEEPEAEEPEAEEAEDEEAEAEEVEAEEPEADEAEAEEVEVEEPEAEETEAEEDGAEEAEAEEPEIEEAEAEPEVAEAEEPEAEEPEAEEPEADEPEAEAEEPEAEEPEVEEPTPTPVTARQGWRARLRSRRQRR
ncbi:prolipoprotein diacylglyceryl transferase [Mycobacterium angelicum]|uniref:Phosphatidylglycerol--prolipoprotein diacylglyceryl transferase n=1 Tax=Mycobacterium angelicum TaxID=470074 RepID=A0A1X0A131_MYCAN|nr:prolipoprotein diacylglyceryl transferase [Mycobacterium angelicum]MCV7195421.1 prolipoprotein diacylglyceryl transferase [Mycobacterium angelicum]ORA23817.1 prolipoprotein diacylglyceryl transferase [Mycobacterium angelicum]